MATTVSLANIHHYAVTIFFCYETFKIYSLSNFQMYNTVLLTIVTMLHDISLFL